MFSTNDSTNQALLNCEITTVAFCVSLSYALFKRIGEIPNYKQEQEMGQQESRLTGFTFISCVAQQDEIKILRAKQQET